MVEINVTLPLSTLPQLPLTVRWGLVRVARENSRMAKSTSRRIVVNFWAAAVAAVRSAKQIETKRERERKGEEESEGCDRVEVVGATQSSRNAYGLLPAGQLSAHRLLC